MENTYSRIQELLHQKADYQARLNLIPYDGSPEIKDREGQKYLYVRKRVGSRLTSTYVDAYSDELYQLLLRNAERHGSYENRSAGWKKSWLRWVMRRQSCPPGSC